MAKVGAKEKCTKEAREKAVMLKSSGVPNVRIIEALNIAESTFYAWCNNPTTEQQRKFSEALKKAEVDYEQALLETVMKAGQEKDWKAAAWLLERKYPERYARTDRVQAEVQHTNAEKVEVVHYFDYDWGESE